MIMHYRFKLWAVYYSIYTNIHAHTLLEPLVHKGCNPTLWKKWEVVWAKVLQLR